MTFSVDLTGLVLFASGVGLICGLILGRIGNIRVFLGAVAFVLALTIWMQINLAQDDGWYSVLNVIGMAITIMALVVMICTFIVARQVCRTKIKQDGSELR